MRYFYSGFRNQDLKRISELEIGWGDESNQAFNRDFLFKIDMFLLDLEKIIHLNYFSLDYPTITPIGEDNIDIHWNNDTFQLLINIEKDEGGDLSSTFYGRIYKTGIESSYEVPFTILGDLIEKWLISII